MIGINSYGSALPVNRIKALDILQTWKNTTKEVLDSLGQTERCVTRADEDTFTLALDASSRTINNSKSIQSEDIDGLIFGSGTPIFSTKPTATVLQDALQLPSSAFVTDVQFSGKSGTSALKLAYSLIKSKQANNVLVVAADTLNLHTPPGHYYEASASAGANAFLLSEKETIATIKGIESYSSHRNDWFRLDGARYLQCGGGFIGYRANWGLLEHIVPATEALLEKTNLKANDIDYAALHQGTMAQVGMMLGKLHLPPQVVFPWTLTRKVGDLGTVSSLMALANVLDQAKPDKNILTVSYGWGAGADALLLKSTNQLADYTAQPTVQELIDNCQYIDYAMSLKYEGKVMRNLADAHANL